MKAKKIKRLVGALLSLFLIVFFALLPGNELTITHAGFCAIGLFLAAITLWITEVFPMAVTACLIVILYPLFGVMSFNETMASFSTSAVVFIFGTFGITAMIKKTSIPARLTSMIIRITKGNSRRLVFLFCLVSGILSGIMSSTATCALFFSIALVVIEVTGSGEKTGIAAALSIGLPVACGIGGFITPAGTPGNIIMMDLLASFGHPISFAQWTVVGIPVGVAALLIYSFFLVHSLDLKTLDVQSRQKIAAMTEQCGKWSRNDILALGITLLMLLLWLLGSVISFFNTATVAIIGLALMFLPGLDLISWDDLKNECSANVMLMIGFSPVIAASLITTGALSYIVTAVFSNQLFSGMNGIVLFVVLSVLFCVVASFIPSPAATISLLGPLAWSITQLANMNSAAVLMVVAFWAASKMLLLYTEPIFFLTLHAGYYDQRLLLKTGWKPALIIALMTACIIPLTQWAGI